MMFEEEYTNIKTLAQHYTAPDKFIIDYVGTLANLYKQFLECSMTLSLAEEELAEFPKEFSENLRVVTQRTASSFAKAIGCINVAKELLHALDENNRNEATTEEIMLRDVDFKTALTLELHDLVTEIEENVTQLGSVYDAIVGIC